MTGQFIVHISIFLNFYLPFKTQLASGIRNVSGLVSHGQATLGLVKKTIKSQFYFFFAGVDIIVKYKKNIFLKFKKNQRGF